MTRGNELAQARASMAGGRWEAARGTLMRMVQRSAEDPEPLRLLSVALAQLGQTEQSLFYARRVVALRPKDAPARHRLVQLMLDDHRYDEALVVADPAAVDGDTGTVLCRALALNAMGRADEAFGLLEALPTDSDDELFVAGSAASIGTYTVVTTAAARKGACVRFGEALKRLMPAAPAAFDCSRDPERPLRVGLASPDLRRHAVGYMVESLLRGLAGRGLEVYCYASGPTEDELSARLKGMCAGWRRVCGPDARASAEIIRRDRIDVLVDLAGHTAGHLLVAMHLRCAPVQATWYGHPGTTGVPAIDYRIVDSLTDPPGTEEWSTERLVRMDPCFAGLLPDADAPEPLEPPSQRGVGAASESDGHITFASFSTIGKLNDELLALWARVLDAAPGSRLVLRHVGLKHAGPRRLLLERFARAGLGASAEKRVKLMEPAASAKEMLPGYQSVDISLDTWPYNGTTTTMESLWMGVPVVSLLADRSAGRVGLSLLSAVGLRDCVASTPEQYIALATGLAADPARLAELRRTLRGRYAASPLGDVRSFGGRFESALREMWRSYCAA